MKPSNRMTRKAIASDTLQIIERGWYEVAGQRIDITQATRLAIDGAELLTPPTLSGLCRQPLPEERFQTRIEVTNETTLQAGQRMATQPGVDDGAVLALNFASAKNAGGGFLGGSQAQEESLARSSSLYPTLTACPDYYAINRNERGAVYTDHMIYSSVVPVFRLDNGDLLPEPYCLTFLTAPAPNAGAIRKNQPTKVREIRPTLERRIDYVLRVAATYGHKQLILGAWGCGVFRNDPAEVAELFAEALLPGGTYEGVFQAITFAVLDGTGRDEIIGPFREVFASEPTP